MYAHKSRRTTKKYTNGEITETTLKVESIDTHIQPLREHVHIINQQHEHMPITVSAQWLVQFVSTSKH